MGDQVVVVFGWGRDPEHVGALGERHGVDGPEALGDPFGAGVVLAQAFHVVFEGVEAGGCEVADLAHAASEHLAGTECPFDGGPVAGQHGAGGCPEALGEAQRHGVDVVEEGVDADIAGGGGVEQAGAVEVDGEPAVVAGGGELGDQVDGLDVAVDGVLEAEQAGFGMVLVGFAYGGTDGVGGERAVGVDLDGPGGGAGECGGTGCLVEVDVVVAADDELVAAPTVGEDGGEVALGARGEEQGGFLAGEFGDVVLEAVDGGVLAVDVVADVGGCHGLAHGGGGHREGVAAEVAADRGAAHRGNASGAVLRRRDQDCVLNGSDTCRRT